MQIFLIHGDDTNKSYARLTTFIKEARKRSWEVIFLDESPLSINENISSASLFGTERFIIHRNISKISSKELNWIKKYSDKYSGNLVLYADKSVPKTFISKLPQNAKIEEFKLPFLLWKFLDSFYPGNAIYSLKLLHQISESDSGEFVFALLSKQIRDLYWAKKDSATLAYPSWRIGKLKNHASKFDLKLLEDLIEDLSAADIKSKTGIDNLISLLDFIIIKKLK